MAKHRALLAREREQVAHDQENAARERKKLKRLNHQILAQIRIVQNTQGPPQSPERPSAIEAQGSEHSEPKVSQNNPAYSFRMIR